MTRLDYVLYHRIDVVQQMIFLGQQHGHWVHIQGFPAIETVEPIPLYVSIVKRVLPGHNYGDVLVVGSVVEALHNVIADLELFAYVLEGLQERVKERKKYIYKTVYPG